MKQPSTRAGSPTCSEMGAVLPSANCLEDKEIKALCKAKALPQWLLSRTVASADGEIQNACSCWPSPCPDSAPLDSEPRKGKAYKHYGCHQGGHFQCSDPQSWSLRPTAVRAILGNPRGSLCPRQPLATASLVSGAGGLPTHPALDSRAARGEVKTQRACEGN